MFCKNNNNKNNTAQEDVSLIEPADVYSSKNFATAEWKTYMDTVESSLSKADDFVELLAIVSL